MNAVHEPTDSECEWPSDEEEEEEKDENVFIFFELNDLFLSCTYLSHNCSNAFYLNK